MQGLGTNPVWQKVQQRSCTVALNTTFRPNKQTLYHAIYLNLPWNLRCSLKGRYEAGEDTEDGSENKVHSKDRVSFRCLGKAGPEAAQLDMIDMGP